MKAALQLAAGNRRAEPTNATGMAPVRVGKKQVAGFFVPEVGKQLRLMAVENSTTVQALLTEALNDLFSKHQRPPIA